MLTRLACLMLASGSGVPAAAVPSAEGSSDAADVEGPMRTASETLTRWSPLQLSLFAPVQLVPARDDVYGLRLSVGLSTNRSVFGVDLGLASTSEQAAGLHVAALWNSVARAAWGLQLAGLFNFAERFTGLRVALLNVGSEVRGVELGLLNVGFRLFGGASLSGAQVGALDLSSRLSGVQVGVYNETTRGAGLQVGVVNVAGRDFHGLQLGLVNLIRGGPLPFLPLVNASL